MAERGSLPRDAIFDILSWTPVRSLCRFRCVSKEWLSGISSPAFIAQHRSRAWPEPLVVAGYHGKPDGVLVMDMKGNVLRTIEGLGSIVRDLCSSLDNLITIRCADSTHVVNVATGRKVVLLTHSESDEGYYYTIRLGRAATSGSCKVVRIEERRDDRRKQTCEVITLRDGAKWKRAQPPPVLVCLHKLHSSGATVKGALYFLSDSENVLCFDLESEKWSSTIRAPPEANVDLLRWTEEIRTTDLNDALCMIRTKVWQPGHLCINIWLLTDPHNSIWVKAHTIPMSLCPPESLCVMPYRSRLLLYYISQTWPEDVLRVYDTFAGTSTNVMKLTKHTFSKIGICNLHLDSFVTPHIYI